MKKQLQNLSYSYTREDVELNPEFPIHMFSHTAEDEQLYNLHSHNTLEVGLCLRGNGVFIIGNRIHSYGKGDMIVINSGIFHRARCSKGKEDLWYFLFFKPEDWSLRDDLSKIPHFIHHNDERNLYHILKALIDEITDEENGYREAAANLLRAFTLRLARLREYSMIHENQLQSPGQFEIDERIIRAMDLMISSIHKPLSMEDLAADCCLSESHFRHLFRQQIGVSPKEYLTSLRIMTAMNLLKNSHLKIVDISYECGFLSLSSFNRQFKAQTGLSPLRWRSENFSDS
ncbi:MAG: AraC family transcriptional regulator [Spirochaetales bacterium]|nr:AraC family transcriptional regulator [Spirochaetales bacterium]